MIFLLICTLFLSITPASSDPLEGSIETSKIDKSLGANQSQYSSLIDTSTDKQQSAGIDEYNLSGQIPVNSLNFSKQSPINAVDLQANHGVRPVGVIGEEVDMLSGRVLRVFPQSNLVGLGIRPGDIEMAINGHAFYPKLYFQTREGAVGEIIQLTFMREGHYRTVNVPRIDARLLKYTGDAFFTEAAAKTTSW